jgi:RNA polymerase sigma-70 factor (ECF subfamily)
MRKDKHIDSGLVNDYQNENPAALVQLVERWHKAFCKKAFFIVKDSEVAKDVAQESWKTIIKKLDSLKDASSFGGWALRIVNNKAIDVLRVQSRLTNTKKELKRTSEIEEPYTENKELKNLLLTSIQSLSVEQQQVVRLFYLNEYSLSEIAEMLQLKKGTVKSRLFHAREKLKIILKAENKHY